MCRAKTALRHAQTQVCHARDTPARRTRRRAVAHETHLRHAATHLCHGKTPVCHARNAGVSCDEHMRVTPATAVCRGETARCQRRTQVCRAMSTYASWPAHNRVAGSAHARQAGNEVCRRGTSVPRAHGDTANAQSVGHAAPRRLCAAGTRRRASRRRHGASRGRAVALERGRGNARVPWQCSCEDCRVSCAPVSPSSRDRLRPCSYERQPALFDPHLDPGDRESVALYEPRPGGCSLS